MESMRQPNVARLQKLISKGEEWVGWCKTKVKNEDHTLSLVSTKILEMVFKVVPTLTFQIAN